MNVAKKAAKKEIVSLKKT
jgi:hypothetical protein